MTKSDFFSNVLWAIVMAAPVSFFNKFTVFEFIALWLLSILLLNQIIIHKKE